MICRRLGLWDAWYYVEHFPSIVQLYAQIEVVFILR